MSADERPVPGTAADASGVPTVATKAAEWNPEDDTGELEPDVPTCRVCGCTDEQACEGGCSWVEDPQQLGELCSRCLPLVKLVRDGIRAELRRPPVVVNVNLTADLTGLDVAKIDHLFRGLAELRQEAWGVQ